MSGESSTEIHNTSTYISSDSMSLDFGESSLAYLAAQAGNASIDGLTSRRDLRTEASRNAKQFHLLSLSTI